MSSLLKRFQALYPAMKRLLDIVTSGAGLILFAPLLLLLFLLVRVTNKGSAMIF